MESSAAVCNVLPAQTLRLVDALIAADKDVDMLIVPGAEHLFHHRKHYALRRTWDYLEGELEADPRGFLRDQYFSFSAGPYPDDFQAPDPLTATPEQVAAQTRSGGACLGPGATMRDGLVTPDPVPDWLAADLDDYVAEFERTGLSTPLHWYRAMDLSWAELAPWEGTPITVPALFVGADLDVATQWSSEAVAAFDRTVPRHRPSVVLGHCGHWFTRERPAETTAAILGFLRGLDAPSESAPSSPDAP